MGIDQALVMQLDPMEILARWSAVGRGLPANRKVFKEAIANPVRLPSRLRADYSGRTAARAIGADSAIRVARSHTHSEIWNQ